MGHYLELLILKSAIKIETVVNSHLPLTNHWHPPSLNRCIHECYTEVDLGFIIGGLTQGTNLLGGGVRNTPPSMRNMLELGGSGA